MKTRALLIALVVAAAPAAVFAWPTPVVSAQPDGGAKKKVDLRPKFKKGDKHRFNFKLDQKTTQDLPEVGKSEQAVTQDFDLSLTVKESDPEKGATLELKYERIKMSLGGDVFGDLSFDSSKPVADDANNPAAAIFRPIVGVTLTVETDPNGMITKVSGGESLGMTGAAGMAGAFTGADLIKNMWGPILSGNRGGAEAAVGESWTNDTEIASPMGKVRLKITSTLKSHTGGKAAIDMDGSFVLDGSSAAVPGITVKDSGLSGRAVWDTELGIVSTIDMTQKLKTERSAGGQTVSTVIDSTSKVTRLPK